MSKSKAAILVVDDEQDIREIITFNLEREGYSVVEAEDGETALDLLSKETIDLVVLDLMMPGLDGLDVCARLKQSQQWQAIPIIMVSAKGDEADIVTGLQMGADDYVVKPFSPKVLVARIKSVLRRRSIEVPVADDNAPITVGRVSVHPGKHEVQVDGQPCKTTQHEFKILHFMLTRPGWVFTRRQIMDAISTDNFDVTERSVDVQIVGLRKKIGLEPSPIETVRGIGYRYQNEE